MKLSNKYAVGCHVMFYEIDMVPEYMESVLDALEPMENPENVTFDFLFNISQYFEKIDTELRTKEVLIKKFEKYVSDMEKHGANVEYRIYDNEDVPYFIGDYRRDFNTQYCIDHDLLVWGESDCLMPKEMFVVLENVDVYAREKHINKYVLTFGIRKMWDESWSVLEHPFVEGRPYHEMHEPEKWKTDKSSIWYTMDISEMNNINGLSKEMDVRVIDYPRFDGSGLVISSDLVLNGCNVPPGVWACGEDTAFQNLTMRMMGKNFRQFIVKNILKVHNRNHPKKRMYVQGEKDMKTNKEKRKSNNKWMNNHKICEYNLAILGDSQEAFKDRIEINE
jgi:hypothetical protein